MRNETFRSLIVWQTSWSNTRIAVESSPQAEALCQCRRRVANQLSSDETMTGERGKRQRNQERQSRAHEDFQLAPKWNHLRSSWAELQQRWEGANERTRLCRSLKPVDPTGKLNEREREVESWKKKEWRAEDRYEGDLAKRFMHDRDRAIGDDQRKKDADPWKSERDGRKEEKTDENERTARANDLYTLRERRDDRGGALCPNRSRQPWSDSRLPKSRKARSFDRSPFIR